MANTLALCQGLLKNAPTTAAHSEPVDRQDKGQLLCSILTTGVLPSLIPFMALSCLFLQAFIRLLKRHQMAAFRS